MEEKKEVIENKTKLTYDGRQKYFDALKVWLYTFGQAQQTGNVQGIINSIEGILFMTAPFIKKDDFDKIAKKILKVRQLFFVARKEQGLRLVFETEFFKLKTDIFSVTRHMWVAVKADDATELDMASFFRESDL